MKKEVDKERSTLDLVDLDVFVLLFFFECCLEVEYLEEKMSQDFLVLLTGQKLMKVLGLRKREKGLETRDEIHSSGSRRGSSACFNIKHFFSNLKFATVSRSWKTTGK